MVFSRLLVENEIKTKRVESLLVTCLDESSILSDSTKKTSLNFYSLRRFYFIEMKFILLSLSLLPWLHPFALNELKALKNHRKFAVTKFFLHH